MMASFAHLIAKLEEATEGHEDFDIVIGDLLDPIAAANGDTRPIIPYTRSLDAAVTLVPEGWWLKIDIARNRGSRRAQCHCKLEQDSWTQDRDLADDEPFEIEVINRPTGPLAVCIAALKARQTSPPLVAGAPDTGAERAIR